MTTYIKREIKFSVTENSNGSGIIVKRGDKATKFSALDTLAYAEVMKSIIQVATVDKDLMLGTSITAGKILLLETDGEVTVKLVDVVDTGIIVKPVDDDDTEKRGTLYIEGSFDHVYVSNAGATDVTVIVSIVGS